MAWREDAEHALPGPHPREPSTLRQDILDELADHLAAAAERESERGAADDDTAWLRALEAFGDPAAVARQLWWDAMRERVMRDWIQTGLLAGIILVVAGLGMMQYRQQHLMEELLRVPAAAQPAAMSNWRVLEIHAARGTEDGPPADIALTIHGKALGPDLMRIEGATGESGRFATGPILTNEYHLRFSCHATGYEQRLTHPLYPGVEPDVVVVEAPEIKPLRIRPSVEGPPGLWEHVEFLLIELRLEDRNWKRDDILIVRQEGPNSVARVDPSGFWRVGALGPSPVLADGRIGTIRDTNQPLDSLEWTREWSVDGGRIEEVTVTASITFQKILREPRYHYPHLFGEDFELGDIPEPDADGIVDLVIRIPERIGEDWIAIARELAEG